MKRISRFLSAFVFALTLAMTGKSNAVIGGFAIAPLFPISMAAILGGVVLIAYGAESENKAAIVGGVVLSEGASPDSLLNLDEKFSDAISKGRISSEAASSVVSEVQSRSNESVINFHSLSIATQQIILEALK